MLIFKTYLIGIWFLTLRQVSGRCQSIFCNILKTLAIRITAKTSCWFPHYYYQSLKIFLMHINCLIWLVNVWRFCSRQRRYSCMHNSSGMLKKKESCLKVVVHHVFASTNGATSIINSNKWISQASNTLPQLRLFNTEYIRRRRRSLSSIVR